MTTAQTDPPDRLAQVSSLYGPGTVTSWYLTLVSIILSWLLHPQKRRSDSIDVDLITVLTLPAVAAGHLLYLLHQIRHLLLQCHGAQVEFDGDAELVQMFAAAEAPLVITNVALLMSAFLVAVAASRRGPRRSLAVTVVFALCLGTEIYVLISVPRSSQFKSLKSLEKAPVIRFPRGFEDILLRSPAVRFPRGFENSLLLSTAVLIQGLFGLAMILLWGKMQDYSRRKVFQIVFGALRMASSCLAALLSFCLYAGRYESTFAQIWIPTTGYSITDLDQAVATAPGATVLGCSIYNTAMARHRARKAALT